MTLKFPTFGRQKEITFNVMYHDNHKSCRNSRFECLHSCLEWHPYDLSYVYKKRLFRMWDHLGVFSALESLGELSGYAPRKMRSKYSSEVFFLLPENLCSVCKAWVRGLYCLYDRKGVHTYALHCMLMTEPCSLDVRFPALSLLKFTNYRYTQNMMTLCWCRESFGAQKTNGLVKMKSKPLCPLKWQLAFRSLIFRYYWNMVYLCRVQRCSHGSRTWWRRAESETHPTRAYLGRHEAQPTYRE